MALRQKQLNASINTTGAPKVAEGHPPPVPPNKRTLYFIKQILRRSNQ